MNTGYSPMYWIEIHEVISFMEIEDVIKADSLTIQCQRAILTMLNDAGTSRPQHSWKHLFYLTAKSTQSPSQMCEPFHNRKVNMPSGF